MILLTFMTRKISNPWRDKNLKTQLSCKKVQESMFRRIDVLTTKALIEKEIETVCGGCKECKK